MSKRLVQTGFTVIPQMGVLDEETDILTATQFPPIQVACGGLTAFEHSEWPVQLAAVKAEFAKALEDEEAAQLATLNEKLDAASENGHGEPKRASRAKGGKKVGV